ncbi:SprB repeat-containing protein, partial [Arthrospira platensis SPKY1]|nr:SprB repeat-containing protein [Arthrospira platensis SPKY1]
EALALHSHNIRQIRCPGLNDGAISFKVSGGDPPFRYEWSNGAITPWIGQLEEGTYSVTVTDQRGCTAKETFTIETRQDIYLNYAVTPASGPFANDGAVIIRDLIGAPGPQTFEWDSGIKGNALNRVPPGEYHVQVQDAEDCRYDFRFEIPYGYVPGALAASLPKDLLPPEVLVPVEIESPEAQTVHFKIYDERSRLISQQVVDVVKGKTKQYFQTPRKAGSYLIQIL